MHRAHRQVSSAPKSLRAIRAIRTTPVFVSALIAVCLTAERACAPGESYISHSRGVSLAPAHTHGRRRVHVRTHTRNAHTHTHANNGKIYRYVHLCTSAGMLFYERFKTIYNMCAGNTYAHTRTRMQEDSDHTFTRTSRRHAHIAYHARALRICKFSVSTLCTVLNTILFQKMFILH